MAKKTIFIFFAALFVFIAISCSDIDEIDETSSETEEIIAIAEEPQIPDYITINGESYSTNETKLELYFVPLTNADIEQIKYMVNLQSLTIAGIKELSDIGPLAELVNLTELSLSHTTISDIGPLAGLTNLEYLNLDLRNTPITEDIRSQISELWAALPNTTINDALQILPYDTRRGTERKMQASANEIDEKALGKWETIDFVENIDDFVPGQESNLKNLSVEYFYLASCVFFENGTVLREFTTYWKIFGDWKSGYILNDPSNFVFYISEDDFNNGLRAYEIKTINGQEYMFVERDGLAILLENGDWTISDRPWLYVLKKTISHSEAISQYDSISRDYDWYLDQGDTGEFSGVNCGPTSAVMAAKWYDRDFAKTPEEVRNEYDIESGTDQWWSWKILDFLKSVNVNAKMAINLNLENSLNHLDMGNILLVSLNMKYVNGADVLHIIVVKGYKIFDGEVYFEVYDPASMGATYYDGSPTGKDRLYSANEVIEGNLDYEHIYIVVNAP